MASIGNYQDLGIKLAAISDVASTDSGEGGDDATLVAAINAIIDALEACGILTPNGE
jgi:hypothetical protein